MNNTETEMERRERQLAEVQEMNANTQKLLSETALYDKKTKWYEIALALAAGAIIATLISKL